MADGCSSSSTLDISNKVVPIKDMICYCFRHTKHDIIDDYLEHGKSNIEIDVRQKVKEKRCTCEVRNPKGKCCLGDIRNVINSLNKSVATVS